jgi:hypothetical protein
LTSVLPIGALGKAEVLFIGGWLVLNGQSDVGIVVASLTGLQRIDGSLEDAAGANPFVARHCASCRQSPPRAP